MNDSVPTSTQELLDRLRTGDTSARDKLVQRLYDRLAELARRILHVSFPRLERLHSPDSVLHEGLIKLVAALRHHQPANLPDFLGFAALQMRRWLLDQTRRPGARGREILAVDVARADPDSEAASLVSIDSTNDPGVLAMWTEFHEAVERLPEELRQVVDLCVYDGLSQQEAADILGLSQPTVSRRLGRAVTTLPDLPA
jgi:RNA polymerase sigma-70 factor (ECF subfamily)